MKGFCKDLPESHMLMSNSTLALTKVSLSSGSIPFSKDGNKELLFQTMASLRVLGLLAEENISRSASGPLKNHDWRDVTGPVDRRDDQFEVRLPLR